MSTITTSVIDSFPEHPDPRDTTWSEFERAVILRYGQACFEAGIATAKALAEHDATASTERIAASTHQEVFDALEGAHELSGPPHERIRTLIQQRDEARAAATGERAGTASAPGRPFPLQPVVLRAGRPHFKMNRLVRALVDILNTQGIFWTELPGSGYSNYERMQMLQLLGASTTSYSAENYVDRASYELAAKAAWNAVHGISDHQPEDERQTQRRMPADDLVQSR